MTIFLDDPHPIFHPDKPGIYLACIECDGAMYHSSVYARERDNIRRGVLEGLGWTLFRVRSVVNYPRTVIKDGLVLGLLPNQNV